MAKSEITSKKVAASASKVLRSKSEQGREVGRRFGVDAEGQQGNDQRQGRCDSLEIMRDPKPSKAAKSAAASALTQKANKKK